MRWLLPFFLVSAALPVAAEDVGDDSSLMERGVELFLEGLMDELGPRLDDLEAFTDDLGPALSDFIAEMGPALRGILEDVEDWSAYEAPEILPNGDILIRRKSPQTPLPDEDETVDEPVDL